MHRLRHIITASIPSTSYWSIYGQMDEWNYHRNIFKNVDSKTIKQIKTPIY